MDSQQTLQPITPPVSQVSSEESSVLKHPLSSLATVLISAFEDKTTPQEGGKISVNPLVSKIATWYEKLRNVMEYREEEVILRSAIERILKRRLLLGGNGKAIAESLIRELVWARYFPDNAIPEVLIGEVEKIIDVHIAFRGKVLAAHRFPEGVLTEWMFHLMSSAIEYKLNPKEKKEVMSNFMFHILKPHVTITDDTQETKDAQVFIAVRRGFSKDDIAFLRYHLFNQIFGQLNSASVDKIAAAFPRGFKEIQRQLLYSLKDRIYMFIQNKTAVFLILEDLLRIYDGSMRDLAINSDELKKAVFAACESRYNHISVKVHRAVIRSVIFLLITKAILALAVEGTFESLVYGDVHWTSIAINTSIPPLLMVLVGIMMKAPKRDNSERIFNFIKSLLFDEHPSIGNPLAINKKPARRRPVLDAVFTLLWLLTYIVSFGMVIFILSKLQFTVISMAIFLFFLAVVSFLAYRIGLMSRVYIVEQRPGWLTPLIDFFFVPIIRVGRNLTEGIAQINILLFIFDYIIETPFKSIFGFFEQWFFYLHTKRENLG